MSPEIYVNGIQIADTPDETGDHRAINENPLRVEFDPEKPWKIVVQTAQLAGKEGRGAKSGRRTLHLNRLGIGVQRVSGGEVLVRLREPVFSEKKGTRYPEIIGALRREHLNRWLQGHGRR